MYSSSSELRRHHQSINQSICHRILFPFTNPAQSISHPSRCKSKNHMTTLMKTPSPSFDKPPFPQKPLFLLLYHNKTNRQDSLTQSPNHPLTHSPNHPLTHSLTHPLTHSPTHLLTHLPTYCPPSLHSLCKLRRLTNKLPRDRQSRHDVQLNGFFAAQEPDFLRRLEAEAAVEFEVARVAAFEVGGAVFGVGL